MQVIKTAIPDVLVFEPKIFGDERGFFMETFRRSWFVDQNLNIEFVQDNHSCSSQGVLRGLHYQTKMPQGKLVRVIKGEVYDVAVDLRKSSPTFGKYVDVMLSETNKRLFWVPPGFAHGFYVISQQAEFIYKCTGYYAPEYERTVLWNDPYISIDWPLINNEQPCLSDKDIAGRLFQEVEYFE